MYTKFFCSCLASSIILTTSSTSAEPINYIFETDFGFEREQDPLERILIAISFSYSCGYEEFMGNEVYVDESELQDLRSKMEIWKIEEEYWWGQLDEDFNFVGEESARIDAKFIDDSNEVLSSFVVDKYFEWGDIEKVVNCTVIYSFLDGVRSAASTRPAAEYTLEDLRSAYSEIVKDISR